MKITEFKMAAPQFWNIQKLEWLRNSLSYHNHIWPGDSSFHRLDNDMLRNYILQNPRWPPTKNHNNYGTAISDFVYAAVVMRPTFYPYCPIFLNFSKLKIQNDKVWDTSWHLAILIVSVGTNCVGSSMGMWVRKWTNGWLDISNSILNNQSNMKFFTN